MEHDLPSGRARSFRGALFSALVLVLAWASSAATGQAGGVQPLLYQQNLVNDDRDGEETRQDPAVMPLTSGGFLLLWVDASRGQTDILARRFAADLEPQADPERINDDDGFWPQSDVILSAPAGGLATAVWTDGRLGGSDLFAQVLAASDGHRVGANLRLSDDPNGASQSNPCCATDSAGTSFVCWTDLRSNVTQVWGRRIGPDGLPGGANLHLVPESAAVDQRNPAIAALPGGGWLLAWDQQQGQVRHVYYRILAADGSVTAPPVAAEGADGINQAFPALLARSGDLLLVWLDDRERYSDVWGQWLSPDGSPDGAVTRLRTATEPSGASLPRAFPAPDGTFALTWFGAVQDRLRPLIRFFAADRTPRAPEWAMADPPDRSIVTRAGVAAPLPDSGLWVLSWTDDWSLNTQVYLDTADPAAGPRGLRRPALSRPGSASQIFGNVALLPDGRAVVTWGDARNGTYNIMGRLLGWSGAPDAEHPSFQVNVVPINRRFLGLSGLESMYHFAPRVAASGTGTFVVTWGVDSGGGKYAYYAQLFDPDGQPIGDNFLVLPPVPGTEPGPQFDARPAMGSDGRFAVVLQSAGGGHGAGSDDITLQMFTPEGQPNGDPILVEDQGPLAGQLHQSPTLAVSPFDEMVVAWSDGRAGNNNWDIYRHRLDAEGRRVEPEDVQLNTPDDPSLIQLFPSTATNGDIIVTVWEENPLLSGLVRGRWERLPSAAARPQGRRPAPQDLEHVDFVVNGDDHPSGLKRPQVAISPSGNFVVTWWDFRGGQTRLWAQRFNAHALAVGAPYALNGDEHIDGGAFPSVAVNDSILQYVWTDSRRGLGWDIFARRVKWDFDGQVPVELNSWAAQAGADGLELRWSVPLGTQFSGFRLWRDVPDGPAGSRPSPDARCLTGWISPSPEGDYRYLDTAAPPAVPLAYYLEARELDGTSRYFGPLETSWQAPTAWRAAPNPFRDQVQLVPPRPGPIRLEVWNAAGRRVRVLERPDGGTAPLVWDGRDAQGRDAASGVYWLRIPSPGGGNGPEPFKILRLR